MTTPATPEPRDAAPLPVEPIADLTGPGEACSNIARLAAMFPDAVVDGRVDLDVLRDLLGDDAEPTGTETSGLRWVGMAEARRLSTLPATGTLLPRPDESVKWDDTKNVVIEGDNLEVLRLLRRAYTSKVDVIYIDPPYNTGNDFVYDDNLMSTIADHEIAAGLRDDEGVTQVGAESDRVAERRQAANRHAKWLSMMYPRLLVAHSLLKETGVFIAAIDDTEHARFKLLLDRVFGAENFISNVVWQGGRKNDSRYVSNGADYMLIYAKNEGNLRARETRWRETKQGVERVLEEGRYAWEVSGGNEVKARERMRNWFKSQPSDSPVQAMARYVYFLPNGDLARDDNITWPGGDGPTYDVLHPDTGKPVPVPEGGWRYSTPERMQEAVDAGFVIFRKDHTFPIALKKRLEDVTSQVVMSVFDRQRTHAGRHLKGLFDDKALFDYPKDTDVLARWIDLVTQSNPNALVLDFFAGSGSTGHAVMDLNAADGGNRRYLLVQLDEPVHKDGYETIADITRERLRRAGRKIAQSLPLESADIDLGFRSYRLASSNIRPWDGTRDTLNLLEAVDNLVPGRSTDDLLVEMMLRLGIDLTTPVERREVGGSTLYNLGGTLYAYFGEDVTTEKSVQVARALVEWRDVNPVDSDVTLVVRDTGFVNSSAKLNLEAAVKQAGFTTFRSI